MASHIFLPLFTTVKLTPTPHFTPRNHTRMIRTRAKPDPDDSYLGMWKKAVEREKKVMEFNKIAKNTSSSSSVIDGENEVVESAEVLEKKSNEFKKILEVSKEERDRAQRIQVVDRAAAAIAAARALLKDTLSNPDSDSDSLGEPTEGNVDGIGEPVVVSEILLKPVRAGKNSGSLENSQSSVSVNEPPGPDFWSWTPPPEDDSNTLDALNAQRAPKISGPLFPTNKVMEKKRSKDIFLIPFQSKFSLNKDVQDLPPFQSFMEVHEAEAPAPNSNPETPALKKEIAAEFSTNAAEAADALQNVDGKPSCGVNPDGSRWWKETGVEIRPNGVVCRWTLERGVTADGVVEWEDKYWEAADEFDHKELGSEKSGRDSLGNVWREYWKESMWQEHGQLHMEKTADKWGKNGKGDEWQEKWFEHYDETGKAEKWAHKSCSIDPNTEVEVGHAHVWNERWGETYDGQGGSIKYTDKWAERREGDEWVKWGDKWDENFDQNGHGVKQGETWWQGKYGEQWNRTWGEGHNGSGWLHKYGRSSSGEHWDTHAQEDTWYERYPHFGFMHCLVNSVQLRKVQKPSEFDTS